MAVKTRKPTGTPAWDLMLIAACPKCGKSYACAEASACDFIGRTFWLGWGEADPDEYGALVTDDGRKADFEIVDYTKTYAGLMQAVRDVIAEPRVDPAKPNLIILDKASKVWDLLSDQADHAARVRDAKKKKLDHVPSAEAVGDEVTIGNDLWNSATNRWLDLLDLLKTHDGPVILTANLKEVTIMDSAGRPTKQKQWKIEGQKNFAADVSCVVEIPALREVYVTGVRSLKFEPVTTGVHTAANRFKDFTVEKLWATLGLTADTAKREHATLIRPGTNPDGDEPVTVQRHPLASEVNDAIAAAVAAPLEKRLDALKTVWDKYGQDTLVKVPAMAPDRTLITAAALITGWVNDTRGQLTPPATGQEPVKADAHALLMDEIQGMAATLGVNPGEFVKPLIDKHEGATVVKDIAAAQVLSFVAYERPRVIAALREQGHATAADAYAKVPDAVWGTWEQLTSPRETEQAAAPVNA